MRYHSVTGERRINYGRHDLGVILTALMLAVVLLALTLFWSNSMQFLRVVIGVSSAVVAIIVIRKPYVGLLLTVAAIPLQNIIPRMPSGSTAVVALGLLTLISVIIHHLIGRLPLIKLGKIHIFALLLCLWLLFTSPDIDFSLTGRNWHLTYLQLWVLMVLTTWLLHSEQMLQKVAWSFLLATVVGIVWLVPTGEIQLKDFFSVGSRPSGAFGIANEQAVYIVIAFVFWMYLFQTSSKPHIRSTLWAFMPILLTGFWVTLSRIGFSVGILAVALHLMYYRRASNRLAWTIRIVLILVAFLLLVPSQYYDQVTRRIIPSITEGTDTVGVRYALWHGAIDVWKESPISGAGIGRYSLAVQDVIWSILPRKVGAGGHSSYFTMLAETGVVGITLFFLWQITALVSLRGRNNKFSSASRICWFVILVVMMTAGLTHSFNYSKLLWMAGGVASLKNGFGPFTRTVAKCRSLRNRAKYQTCHQEQQ